MQLLKKKCYECGFIRTEQEEKKATKFIDCFRFHLNFINIYSLLIFTRLFESIAQTKAKPLLLKIVATFFSLVHGY